jgi:hypothetical protein
MGIVSHSKPYEFEPSTMDDQSPKLPFMRNKSSVEIKDSLLDDPSPFLSAVRNEKSPINAQTVDMYKVVKARQNLLFI